VANCKLDLLSGIDFVTLILLLLFFFNVTHFCVWFQYFGKRFNRWLQLLASTLFSVQMVIYLALVLYAPALALHQGKLENMRLL